VPKQTNKRKQRQAKGEKEWEGIGWEERGRKNPKSYTLYYWSVLPILFTQWLK
jgi:hypothetical protein